MLSLDPGVLFSGFIISTIGFGVFLYGKRAGRFRSVIAGVAMMALPVVLHSVLWMWVASALAVVGSRFLPGEV